jgi:excisionase family DNA binding protein
MEYTFETLPQSVAQLHVKLEHIEKLLEQKGNETTPPDADTLLTVQDTAKFLRLSVPTIYNLIHKGELPVMKRAKRCYFTREDLLNYLKQGRRKSNSESKAEAFNSLAKRKGGKQ